MRAIAIAAGCCYDAIYAELFVLNRRDARRPGKSRSPRDGGTSMDTVRKYLANPGRWDVPWAWVPTMAIGKGCTVHLRADELPSGRLIVRVSNHLVAVIDGVIHDTHDCSRCGMRCVYGYFTQLAAKQEHDA